MECLVNKSQVLQPQTPCMNVFVVRNNPLMYFEHDVFSKRLKYEFWVIQNLCLAFSKRHRVQGMSEGCKDEEYIQTMYWKVLQ